MADRNMAMSHAISIGPVSAVLRDWYMVVIFNGIVSGA